MNPLSLSRGSVERSGDKQPLVLALLPLDPGACVIAGCEPGIDGLSKVGLSAQPTCKRELGELEPEASPQVAKRPQPVQLGQPVEPVTRHGAPGNDEPLTLEIPQHARRPAAFGGCSA